MSIEEIKQAIKESVYHRGGYYIIPEKEFESLRQAVAVAEKQKPHGYLKLSNAKFYQEIEGVPDIERNPDYLPVYTHPKAEREWVGLTDEEIRKTCVDIHGGYDQARAIEAKLKVKNGY